jgi:hypothetical protein
MKCPEANGCEDGKECEVTQRNVGIVSAGHEEAGEVTATILNARWPQY